MSAATLLREICAESRGQGLAAIGVELLRCRLNERLPEDERLSYFAFAALLGLEGYAALRRKGQPVTVDLRHLPDSAPDPQDVPAQVDAAAEEWRPIEYMPGYEINRAGTVQDMSGRTVRWNFHRAGDISSAYVRRGPGVECSINSLLEETFGEGAAEAAGFKKPSRLDHSRARRGLPPINGEKITPIRDRYTGTKIIGRVCHDCGKPTPNYRCEACWRARRGYGYADAPTVGLDCL